jgi:membrane protease YdiL (CAAX protease family)
MLSEKPWKLDGLIRFVMCLVMSISFMILLSGLVQHFTGAKPDDNSPALLVINSLALDGSILFAAFIFLRFEHLTWSDAFGFGKRTFWHALMWGGIIAVCFSLVGQEMNDLCARALESFHWHPQNEQAVETLRHATPGFNRVYLVFFSIIVAPFAEETLFRGILYPAIKQNGFPRTALWSTSFLFAAIHGNLPAFLPLTLLAIILTILYEKTNNLLSCIFAHSLFNVVGVVLVYYYNSSAPSPS